MVALLTDVKILFFFFFFFFFFLETKKIIFYISVTNIFHDPSNHESFSSSFTLPISHLKCALLNYSLYCPDSLESVNMYTNVKVFISVSSAPSSLSLTLFKKQFKL